MAPKLTLLYGIMMTLGTIVLLHLREVKLRTGTMMVYMRLLNIILNTERKEYIHLIKDIFH